MRVKTLKYIRKYWEYKFCKGKLFMRRKADGKVREYNSVQEFISNFVFNNSGMMAGLYWHDKKQSIIDKLKWRQAQKCN